MRRDSFHVGEGFYEAATVVYPDDPTRRAYVLWVEGAYTAPDWVRVVDPESHWMIAGIQMEPSLTELEQINGRSFQLTGFGWYYGGTIIGWGSGYLATVHLGIMISVRLDLSDEDYEYEGVMDVLGDGNFSSAHPTIQCLDPRVYHRSESGSIASEFGQGKLCPYGRNSYKEVDN